MTRPSACAAEEADWNSDHALADGLFASAQWHKDEAARGCDLMPLF